MKTAICLFVLLAGCAEMEPRRQTYWEKQGASQQEFHMESGQCRAQAFAYPGAMTPGNLNATMQAAAIFASCMQGKGWYAVER